MNPQALFQKKDYLDSHQKTFATIRKNFEILLENNQIRTDGTSSYSSESEIDEENTFNEKSDKIKLYIEQKYQELPSSLLELDSLHDLISFEQLKNMFSQEEIAGLYSLLPDHKEIDKEKVVMELLAGETFFFNNPLDFFLRQTKNQMFSRTRQRELALHKKAYNHFIFEHFQKTTQELKKKTKEMKENKLLLSKRRNFNFLEERQSSETDESVTSVRDLSVENPFSELSPGYSTHESFTGVEDDMKTQNIQDIDVALQENRKIEQQKALVAEANRSKKNPDFDTLSITQKTAKQVKTSTQLKNSLRPISKEWIENYHKQERDRYMVPTRPWTYYCEDGTQAIVAPVAKKIHNNENSKPRDHPLLKTERPPFITILCLVRDAASRLSGGVGTRAQICELLKESQYINENISDEKLSNIVSGALDRLHYENDPCVKYDSEKKLWIYLHRDRTENYPGWVDANESRSSKKKEYNQKYKNKKKLKQEEISFIKTDF